jgi:polyisoprenoid-binding protein YceI
MTGFLLVFLALAPPVHAQARAQAFGPEPTPFPAGRYRLDPEHARIAWSVDHLGFSTFRGLIPAVSGSLRIDPAHPETARLDVSVPMGGISSLDDALDRRLRGPQFFNTARYSVAAYHATGLVMTGPRSAQLQGRLTLCGVTHPLAMNVRFERAGVDPVNGRMTLGFEGTATIRRSLFGIVAYTPLVGDDVGLDLEAEFTPESANKPQ